jgi:hypothetical protein
MKKELQSKDLRIGNLFIEKYRQKIIKVIQLNDEEIYFSGKFTGEWQAEPILLNNDLLFALGLIQSNDDKISNGNKGNEYFIFENEINCSDFFIEISLGKLWFSMLSIGSHGDYENEYLKEIKYVHELQNLYFALTSKELKLKNVTP